MGEGRVNGVTFGLPPKMYMPLTTIKEQHSKKVLFDNWPTFLPLLVKVPLCNFHFNIYTLNKISCNWLTSDYNWNFIISNIALESAAQRSSCLNSTRLLPINWLSLIGSPSIWLSVKELGVKMHLKFRVPCKPNIKHFPNYLEHLGSYWRRFSFVV